ncbi:MAG TPA: response regulator [Candidatus Tectomicrobia bacterium]|nr:response regulator [Candidatus Tectomicrobia bacterium]
MARILIIDDDPEVADTLAAMLDDLGHEAQCVHEAAEGMARAAAVDADVVLLDLNLPRVTGLSAFEALRRRRLGVPIVMISGAVDTTALRQAVRGGAFDYLTKPIELGDLERVVNAAVAARELARRRGRTT